MANQKLTQDQRLKIIEWLAAGYYPSAIRTFMRERGWPTITDQALAGYRKRYHDKIGKVREERLQEAISSGLAIKEERIARLARHADALEELKWVPDENGRLNNEKAWRDTLRQIAEEQGSDGPGITTGQVVVTFKPSEGQVVDIGALRSNVVPPTQTS